MVNAVRIRSQKGKVNQIEKCNKFAKNCLSSMGIVHGIILIVLGIILVVNSFKLKDDEDDSWWVSLIGGIVVFFGCFNDDIGIQIRKDQRKWDYK